MEKKKIILPVRRNKSGQRRITIPKEIPDIKEGDYVLIQKIKEAVTE